jgi:hypothetical protein
VPHDFITKKISPYTTDGMTVTSLSVRLLQKMNAAMDCPCQTALNQKLWCKFKKCKNAKSPKRKPACILKYVTFDEYFANIQQVSKLADTDRTTCYVLSDPPTPPLQFSKKERIKII